MKYFKLFLLVAAIAIFGSCSEDKETQNTNSDVVVEMESPTFSAKESAGSVKVPIKVTGKTNGKVYVTMAVKECGNNPAKEDVHYYVADKTITISDEIGYVEYRAVDDKKINDDRTFQFEIVEAKGAKIGAQKTTTVTIVDNDNAPYDRLQGEWKLTAKDGKGTEVSYKVNITEPKKKLDDGSDNPNYDYDYGYVLYMDGLMGFSGTGFNKVKLDFSYNEKTKQGYLAFNCLQDYVWFTNTFTGLGECDVKIMNADDSNSPLFGYWDSNFTSVTFTPGSGLLFTVHPKSDSKTYIFDKLTDIVLTQAK